MDAPHRNPTLEPEAGQSSGSTAVLAVLVVGTFLAPLDSSIVNIALPAISAQFHIQPDTVSWVATAYLLTSATLLLSMGRLGDVWGLRRLYVSGLLVFGAGSLACALSGSLPMLIGARVLQAVGASMLFAAGPALVMRTFPPQRRGWALGYVSLAVSAGLTVGPALGGLLLGAFGWPSLFLINVPLSLIVAVLAWRILPDQAPQGEPFDLLGAVLAGASLLALLTALTSLEGEPFVSAQVLGALVFSIVAAVAFVFAERRATHPMLDLRLFESRPFSFGVLAAALAYFSLFAVTFNMPFYLLRVRGLAPETAGLVLTCVPLAMAVFAPAAGRASDRIGSRWLSTTGMVIIAGALVLLSFGGLTTPIVLVLIALLTLGTGMAIFQTPNTASVLRATPRARAGVGSAVIAEARNVGMAVGIAATAAIVSMHLHGPMSSGEGLLPIVQRAGFVAGMSVSLRVAAVVALVAAGLSWERSENVVEAHAANP